MRLYFNDCTIEYEIVDNPVSKIWLDQIKHLQHVPVSEIETTNSIQYDIEKAYPIFCDMVGIPQENLDLSSQEMLNHLHDLYVRYHDDHCLNQNLYYFHKSIHEAEHNAFSATYHVGWGVHEGMLTKEFKCNPYYTPMYKNNVYLTFSELGKTPLSYFINGERLTKTAFMALVKPHFSLRPRFTVAKYDREIKPFPDGFGTFFDTIKDEWLEKYGLDRWTELDEYGGVPVAVTSDKDTDISNSVFKRIEI